MRECETVIAKTLQFSTLSKFQGYNTPR